MPKPVNMGDDVDIIEIRRRNALYYADKHGRSQLAARLEYSDTNYLNLICNGNSNMGARTARKFESRLGLPRGWMDLPHPELWADTPEELSAITESLLNNLSTSDLSRLIDMALGILKTRK